MYRLLFCLTFVVLGVGLLVSAKTARAIAAERTLAQADGPHGTVQGKLMAADGSPIGSAWVAAIPVDGEVDANNPEQLTGEDGVFSLDVPPGRYFIVANYDWPATQNAPVLTTYHPSSENEGGAQAVEVKAGGRLRGIDVKATRVLVPRTFDVLVTGPDGKPLPSADAYITQTNQAGIAGSDSGATYADKTGHVKLMGFAGLDYVLFAENGIGAKKTCATMMKLEKDRPDGGVISMQLSMAQPLCRQQEDAARKAAYAMQAR